MVTADDVTGFATATAATEGTVAAGGTTRSTWPTSIRFGFSRPFQRATSLQFCPGLQGDPDQRVARFDGVIAGLAGVLGTGRRPLAGRNRVGGRRCGCGNPCTPIFHRSTTAAL